MSRVLLSNLILLLSWLFATTSTLAVSPPMILTTLDGKQIEGEIVGWKTDMIVVKGNNETKQLPLSQLLRIRPVVADVQTNELETFVDLTDGSRLPLTEVTVTDRVASLNTLLADETLTLATEQIQLVQLSPRAQDADVFWSELAEKQLPGDVLVIQKGKSSQLDYLTGVLGDVSQELVKFNWDGEVIPVKRTKIAALAYYHATSPDLPPVSCWLMTRFGARLPVQSIELEPNSQALKVSAVSGLQFTIPVSDLREADCSMGKLTYLSDLEPLKEKWLPRIGLPGTVELIHQYGLPRRDQSFTGSPLSLRWPGEGGAVKNYAKGLAVRSRTLIEYRILPGMSRFVALVGIDPATAGEGNVELEISADGAVLWQGMIDGGKAPVKINVKLSNARRLRLLVDYGGNLDYGDRLHLVEARMMK
ncbi:MAG: NPCBM/NEW2 domain-containing protein [Aeoliella sp.]